MRLLLLTACTVCVHQFLVSPSVAPAEELRPSYLMLSEHVFEFPEFEPKLPEGIIELWKASLRRPEPFYHLTAAIDIRNASRAGFDEVKAAIPELRQVLRDEKTEPEVREAVAMTLFELDAQAAAKEMFDASRQSSSHFRQLVEPVLAEWGYRPIVPVWRERLKQQATPRRELILACEGIARAGDERALPDLLTIVHSSERPRDVRLSAAKAAGAISGQGLESEVRELLAEETPSLIRRLCAMALLQRHESEQARQLLRKLFDDPAGPVAAAAAERLYAIDPALVLELTSNAWEHPDVKVRRVAADCLIALPTAERIRTLAGHLDDPHPELRSHIRDALMEFAQRPEFDAPVRESVVEVLHSEDWRGQEQACLLLGQLDHEAVAERLIELMNSDRPEVMIASAWALRKIEVKEVLPAMLAQAERMTEPPQRDELTAMDRQVAHLFEAMAVMDYRPSIPLMRIYVPKPLHPEDSMVLHPDRAHWRLSRGAAIWALGHLLVDANDEEFSAQLMERIDDYTPFQPEELYLVKRMSAITLGRMKAVSQLEALKAAVDTPVPHAPLPYSLRWAILQISGEELPYAERLPYVRGGWRIQPARSD